MDGVVTHIQRFSTHDGPGIRTTVFLKGCSNRCAWCHNPETLRFTPEIQVLRELCIGCGRCQEVCPQSAHEADHRFLRDRCKVCGECVNACCSGALKLVGESLSPADVLKEILKDKPYYDNSGGGVTFSGGDPVLQNDFLFEALSLCKENGVHTAIETAGNYPWSMVERLLPQLDLVMYDVKCSDSSTHLEFVGSELETIRKNLVLLCNRFNNVIVRTPVVVGVNASEDSIVKIAQFLGEMTHPPTYELLPYHELGNSKREGLGLHPGRRFETPSHDLLHQFAKACQVFVSTIVR